MEGTSEIEVSEIEAAAESMFTSRLILAAIMINSNNNNNTIALSPLQQCFPELAMNLRGTFQNGGAGRRHEEKRREDGVRCVSPSDRRLTYKAIPTAPT